MASLDIDTVVERAHALTDVDDPDPSHFRDNLEAVVTAMNDEAALNEVGIESNLAMLSLALRNRIEVDRYLDDHPEVDDIRLEPPIVLTGLPRSGTTYFQYLFDQDPTLRMLQTWEGDRPCPPPALDATSVRQRREASANRLRRTREATGRKLDALHLSDVDGPQECLAILDQTFVNPGLLWTMSVSGYLRHLLTTADLCAAYEHHATVLRLLQFGAPERRWALKWPCHLLALDVMAAVYPGARFVVTHRDPVQALASNCSLTHVLRVGTSPYADPEEIGRDMLELVSQHIDRLVAFDVAQSAAGYDSLVHVDYYSLVAAPDKVMPGVFEALGLEWSPAVERRVREWRDANPKGRRGPHEYRLDDYGLDRTTVADAFGDYIERYSIPSGDDTAP